jgi:hypothetical protein
MSFESLMTKCETLKSSMEALAAIGAELRLRREKLSGDSRVRPLLQELVHQIDPELLDDLNANQEEAALALIQTSFGQAVDLMENPAHAPGGTTKTPSSSNLPDLRQCESSRSNRIDSYVRY